MRSVVIHLKNDHIPIPATVHMVFDVSQGYLYHNYILTTV
jgi:hypothetical protein